MLLCGRILLGARSTLLTSPQTWPRKDFAHEVHTLGQFLAVDPFYSRILISCHVPLENLTV